MLTNLIKRINKDENSELQKEALVECAYTGTMHSHIDKFAFIDQNKDFGDLKDKLSGVTLCNTDNVQSNMDKLVAAARAPQVLNDTMTEAVVSTAKTISMTKEDFDNLSELLKVLKKASADKNERKDAKNKIKAFLKACTSEVRKCDDNRPADALVTAMVNKLCKAFECEVKKDEKEISKKALFALKLNALAKAIARIK